MIQIPDSVAFYWGDPVNRAAINVLGATEVPADLSLAEAERFELAGLAARRVRVEYWTMLRALWAATWGESVRACFPRAKLLSYGGHQAFASEVAEPYADPSIDYAWENAGQSGVFEVSGGRLFTAVWLVENEAELQLQFYLLDAEGSCATSDGLDLGPDWGDDGAGRRETRVGRLPFATAAGAVDPEPVRALARAALEAIAVT